MRRNISASFLLVLASIFIFTTSFSLEGRWSLTSQTDLNLDSNLPITFEFKKYLSDGKITRELIIEACY